MHSTYRILQSSNTHTRKQKAPNHTEIDLKMTSKEVKRASIDLKETKESVISYRRSRLKGGKVDDDNSTQGRDPIEQDFSSQ